MYYISLMILWSELLKFYQAYKINQKWIIGLDMRIISIGERWDKNKKLYFNDLITNKGLFNNFNAW